MSRALEFLLSPLYDGALAPEHREDLAKSGLTAETIAVHSIRSVPPTMIRSLIGFDVADVRSACLFPFRSPSGGFMNHVRVKVFPPLKDAKGHTTKYLGPKGAPARLYFPITTMEAVLNGGDPIWFCEGAKKALAVAQLGLPVVGFEGIEAWHQKGSHRLLPDFDAIPLQRRTVELVPDGDVRTNPAVARGAARFAEALQALGARVRFRLLPITQEVAA